MRYLQQAFDAVCKEAKQAETWYVSLVAEEPYYGGPEEGGWWGSDSVLTAYEACNNEDEANAKAEKVKELAAELESMSRREFGERCTRELAWLEARGLDADFLPEPDGETRYHVVVSQGIPENSYGCRQYS